MTTPSPKPPARPVKPPPPRAPIPQNPNVRRPPAQGYAVNVNLPPEVIEMSKKPVERIMSIGVTGSGKSYQWIKMAKRLAPLGIVFRVIDTDNDIEFMVLTQAPELLAQNGGNIYVFPAYEWQEFEQSIKWVKQRGLTDAELHALPPHLVHAYKTPIRPVDWVVVDKVNNAWSRVQSYFVEQAFGDNIGEYFLKVRKSLWESGDIGKSGKKAVSTSLEALDGWKDWSVINKLYDDFILPIVYQVRCNVYATSDVETLDKKEKDPEVMNLFGDLGIKPAGQKKIGGQMHTILLFIPGKQSWKIMTVKDRSDRSYFKKNTPLTDFYMQYLFAKAGWPMMIMQEEDEAGKDQIEAEQAEAEQEEPEQEEQTAQNGEQTDESQEEQ